MTRRAVVGMSGGVDSSVAATLLCDEGFEVIGLTLKLWTCQRVEVPSQDAMPLKKIVILHFVISSPIHQVI